MPCFPFLSQDLQRYLISSSNDTLRLDDFSGEKINNRYFKNSSKLFENINAWKAKPPFPFGHNFIRSVKQISKILLCHIFLLSDFRN